MLRPSRRRTGIASLLSIGLLALFGSSAKAACLASGCRQNGLVFSEASRNFKITDVVGAGTANDPFILYQDVWGLDISLAITGLTTAQQHSVFDRPGFAISIVARNLTGAFWRFYDHELQEIAGFASHENDGLSFAQGIGPARPYVSTHYDRADEITDVRDFINFYRGDGVNPGESVRFDYFVTDTIPNQRFYIRQRPDYRPNEVLTSAISTRPSVPKTSAPHTQLHHQSYSAPISSSAEVASQTTQPNQVHPPQQPIKSQPKGSSFFISQMPVTSKPQPVPEPTLPVLGSVVIFLNALRKQRGVRLVYITRGQS